MRGRRARARAIISRCRCPPESVPPPSVMRVCRPIGMSAMSAASPAARAAVIAASSESGVPLPMFSSSDPDITAPALHYHAELPADGAPVEPRQVAAIEGDDARLRLREAQQEADKSRLARAGGPDHRHVTRPGLARIDTSRRITGRPGPYRNVTPCTSILPCNGPGASRPLVSSGAVFQYQLRALVERIRPRMAGSTPVSDTMAAVNCPKAALKAA